MTEEVDPLPEEDVDKRLATALDNKDMLAGLTAHPGWKFLERMAEAQIDRRKNEIFLKPLTSMDAVVGQEFLKGEATGIATFMAFPQTVIDDADAVIASLTADKEEEVVISGEEESEPL